MDDHRAHIVQRLSERIAMRATADPQHSYTARLLQGPKEAVLRKVGEEALEVVLAAQSTPPRFLQNWKSVTPRGVTETPDGWPPALKIETVPTAF